MARPLTDSELPRRHRPSRWRPLAFGAILATIGLTVGPAAGLAGRFWWVFELAGHFRTQYFWGLAATTAVLVACRRWGWSAAAGVLLVLHAASLWPFYSPAGAPPPGAQPLRIASVNVNGGNRAHNRVLSFIREAAPDVAVFLEVTEAWAGALTALDDGWPHSYTRAQPGTRGIAVYSRLPFDHVEVVDLTGFVPAIVARVTIGGTPVTIFAVHPYPPISREMARLRNLQLADAAGLVESAAGEKILVGDFNATSWSPYFADLISRTGLRDTRLGLGIQPTWPTSLPSPLRIPIDHCLISPGLEIADRNVGPEVGSDHLPIIVDLGVMQPDGIECKGVRAPVLRPKH